MTVGRWFDRPQKRPDLLIRTIDLLLAADPAFEFRVFGKLVPEMESWHASLEVSARQRVRLHGLAPNAELLEAFQTAHIYLCVSSYESFLIAGAEAMGCGCSLVACDSAALPGPSWFAEDHRGTLSSGPSPEALRDAALMEARAWHGGHRDPAGISAWAVKHMHAGRVAASYRRLLDSEKASRGAES
ncbi:glycosyltransferase family 4 protein [Haloferula rosea]|uniref:Glycosyltransferase family 4 protein n=1 Tax=Haloferula rosea TaxID=490093 RepID=A0A934VG98_9BACT|nr:glycosyltransferase family 4 protein [Haloferula rosea]